MTVELTQRQHRVHGCPPFPGETLIRSRRRNSKFIEIAGVRLRADPQSADLALSRHGVRHELRSV